MKRTLTAFTLATLFVMPAAAGSIELIDPLVTGTKGASRSVVQIALPDAAPGTEEADSATMVTAAVTPGKKINVAFARKFPDPAVPVPAVTAPEDGGMDAGFGGIGAEAAPPADGQPGAPADGQNAAAPSAPAAPADAGKIPEQPPVEQADMRGTLPEPGVPAGQDDPHIKKVPPSTGG